MKLSSLLGIKLTALSCEFMDNIHYLLREYLAICSTEKIRSELVALADYIYFMMVYEL